MVLRTALEGPKAGRKMTKKHGPVVGAHLAPGVHRVRVDEGVSQTELGRRLGVSQQFISKVELGEVPITPSCVDKLAGALRVPPVRIYEESLKNP